jgi:ABC-type glycerol-3-phosphate transport system permease component
MAASVLMTVPMILLYFFVQRYIAEGVVTSGIK